jgi:hypothetical protein
MGKQTAQGTAYETHLRTCATQQGRTARRTAKAGQAHEADVIIEGADMRPAVAWKHMIPNGGQKRSSLRTVTILEDDWFRLLGLDAEHTIGWYVQAKCTQRLSVSAIMRGLMQWMRSRA